MSEPFGVVLPDNFDEPSTGAPDAEKDTGRDEADDSSDDLGEAKKPETIQELLDLDKHERFRFAGREWAPKELQNAILMREDYTRKTQEVAEARKFVDNFDADLDKVIANPSLLAQMREIYPASYVKRAEQILSRLEPGHARNNTSDQGARGNGHNQNQDELSPALAKKLAPIEQFIERQQAQAKEAEIQRIDQQLDKKFESFGKKYPEADADVVNSWALALVDRGGKLTDKALETLFKKHHDQVNERYEKRYRGKVEEQKSAGLRARDIGRGGDAAGAPPKKMRLSDVKHQMLADLDAS